LKSLKDQQRQAFGKSGPETAGQGGLSQASRNKHKGGFEAGEDEGLNRDRGGAYTSLGQRRQQMQPPIRMELAEVTL
jgi:hypothetical protein